MIPEQFQPKQSTMNTNLSCVAAFVFGADTLSFSNWTLIQPGNGNLPPAREQFASGYIPQTQEFLVYGGWFIGCNTCNFNEFYSYSLITNNWTLISQNTLPSARRGMASGVDPRNGDFYVFGGAALGTVPTYDLVTYVGYGV